MKINKTYVVRYISDVEDVERVDFNQRYIIRDTFNQYKIIYKGKPHDFFEEPLIDGRTQIDLLCKILNEEYNQYEKQVREIENW